MASVRVFLSALFFAIAACHASSLDSESAIKERMKLHIAYSDAMRDAVIRADFADVRSIARSLANLPVPNVDGPMRGEFAAMTNAAKILSEAGAVQDAGYRIASLALYCGGCHKAHGRTIAFLRSNATGNAGDAHMVRNRRAVDLLWEGIVAPSDQAWKEGAAGLAEAPQQPETLTPGTSPVPDKLALKVHSLAKEALSVEGPERADLFGEVLDRCATCHERFQGGVSDATLPPVDLSTLPSERR